MSGVTVNGNINFNFSMDSTEANAAQNSIRRELAKKKEPISGKGIQVVMYWVQARNHANIKRGDRARIESIYKGDVKVNFTDESLKQAMLYELAYPFEKAFVVDVDVETVEGKPVLYKVTHLYEVLDLDDL